MQGVVWHRSTPILEQYMRWLNENLLPAGARVASAADREMNALISEVAFRSSFEEFEVAEASARAYIATLPRGAAMVDRPFSESDLREIALIRDNIEAYVIQRRDPVAPVEPRFQPRFAGCGVVEPANGDLLLGSELIEIKAVQRPFRSTDIRQLLTYAALGYASGVAVTSLTLLNPRWGTYHRAGVGELAADIGAGSWPELMKDLVEAMSGLEVSV